MQGKDRRKSLRKERIADEGNSSKSGIGVSRKKAGLHTGRGEQTPLHCKRRKGVRGKKKGSICRMREYLFIRKKKTKERLQKKEEKTEKKKGDNSGGNGEKLGSISSEPTTGSLRKGGGERAPPLNAFRGGKEGGPFYEKRKQTTIGEQRGSGRDIPMGEGEKKRPSTLQEKKGLSPSSRRKGVEIAGKRRGWSQLDHRIRGKGAASSEEEGRRTKRKSGIQRSAGRNWKDL